MITDDTADYAAVDEEMKSQPLNAGLWAKSLAHSNGDENAAKAFYTKERVRARQRERDARSFKVQRGRWIFRLIGGLSAIIGLAIVSTAFGPKTYPVDAYYAGTMAKIAIATGFFWIGALITGRASKLQEKHFPVKE